MERAALSKPQQRVPYGEDPINSKLANEGSLWQRAQDFWQVVGWAFNCSIHHRGRWNVWKVWLEYMLDVFEADWNDVPKIHHDEYMEEKRVDAEAMEDMFQNRILIQYISDGARSSTALRRIVKSIFADGSTEALKAYPEVFKDETWEANVKTGTKRKRGVKLNLDEDDYGDYLQNEDDDNNTPAPSQSEVSSSSATEDSLHATITANIAEDPEAVTIRLRLLALVSYSTSDHSFTNEVSYPSHLSQRQAYLSRSENSINSMSRPSSRFRSRHSPCSCHHLPCLTSLLSLYHQLRKLISPNSYHGVRHVLMMMY
jgi:hypothetical protein